MGLKKRAVEVVSPIPAERRHRGRNCQGLIQQLASWDVQERRWAARDLAACPQAAEVLLQALAGESEHVVREAIFDSLQQIGGERVVAGLIDLLRSEDAALRNGAIEVLQSMPDEVAPHIGELLCDSDSDVRIFAIDILQQLAHPRTPEWLLSILQNETHVNVVAAAVDRVAEVGTLEMIPALEAVKQRFAGEPFIGFAVDVAIRRIRGG